MNSQRSQRPTFLKILLWPFKSYLRIIAVVIFIGIYQYQSIQIDILAREVRNLELRRTQLMSEKSALQVEIDQLTHINRIERLARERFGLIAPGEKMEKLVIRSFTPQKPVNDQDRNEALKLAGVN